MRSFGAAALFTLAIITECYGAQSDRSRSRSGPIRSVPVAADIKREVDFDCPEEFGYYPHPTDCTLYYVCVFGGALLESCTGGLMYSHELQTCDWPRNVGCDGTSAVGGEELERINEREPPRRAPPPPRRTPPPPPPRAQPNPVITSRGQPKFNRQEYEKQQQLYAEVDDLPPVEEIESDRQQRVYRGQPATIGQVQKDRDGYGAQPVNSGRNFNSNIIPASLPQTSGKIGSFSFGSQVDERRTAAVTPAPQSYSEDKSDSVTDSSNDRQLDIETNEIVTDDVTEKSVLRKKRELVGKDLGGNETSSTQPEQMSKRSDSGEEMEYIELNSDIEDDEDVTQLDETERGKRQVRYYLKNGYKSPQKNWALLKPVKLVEYPQSHHNSNVQNSRYQPTYNNLNNNNFYEITRRPQSHSNNVYSSANPFLSYQIGNSQSQGTFKPSLPDPSSQPLAHNPLNAATQIITKSPPISSLNNGPFNSLAGGFYNNAPQQSNVQYLNQYYPSTPSSISHQNNPISFPDSSHVPSTIVTGKPVLLPTSPRPQENYRNSDQGRNTYVQNKRPIQNNQQPIRNGKSPQKYVEKRPSNDKEYDDEDDSGEDEEESSEEEEEEDDDHHNNDYPKPPYEFTHPHNKYKDIENPFANPSFDFDAYLSKLSNGQYSPGKPNSNQRPAAIIQPSIEVTTISQLGSRVPSSTVSYIGMSTPKPFTVPSNPGSSIATAISSVRPFSASINQAPSYDQFIQRPEPTKQSQQQQQQKPLNENAYVPQAQQTAGISLDSMKPMLKPPNFKDERQLPISYSFSRPISSTSKPYEDHKSKGENYHTFSASPKPYLLITGTGSPIILSTPKHQYIVKPEKIISLNPHIVATAKPYLVSSIKPHNAYIAFKQSTPKPLTTIANEQLSALQQYWKHPSTESVPYHSVSFKPSTTPKFQRLENLFPNLLKSNEEPLKNHSNHLNLANTYNNSPITTTKAPPKRRPIPKPSPEMNDYYYDDEDEPYYSEPVVKPKYMPSSEIKPQRPPMAQNYKEYEDSYEDFDAPVNTKSQPSRVPIKYNHQKPESGTKNYNDVSVSTKAPYKDFHKNINGKIPIPVLVDYGTPAPNTLIRPEGHNYQIIHHMPKNRTIMHIRRPVTDNGPNTVKPPKYLNHTTLRPYTVRHRLAKPTTVKEPSQDEDKQIKERIKHPNIVAQMKLTTPRDNQNQETKYTKIKHDDKTNSLEPTESVTPVSYSASPRPKMLYNGSQNYSPDQYDPYYAVYDEDGELYKDTDYVQQYNTASLRPAVQQTYRGTPPPAPARRPVETYTPRPAPVDYDDELIQPQINNQNQYQTPVRQSTRGEGNELGYDHIPSSVRTTLYEATTLSTTPSTTSTSTTTQRPTTAPYTEAMTPSRNSPRSSTDENPIPESFSKPSDETTSSGPNAPSPTINIFSLAKPFEKTDNLYRLKETVSTTETLPTSRRSSEVTNNNDNVEVVRSKSNRNNKKVSLTSGFSIRRNPNNTNNPYTLTVLTRPLEDFDKARKSSKSTSRGSSSRQTQSDRYYYDTSSDSKDTSSVESVVDSDSKYETSSEKSRRRNDFGPNNSEDDYDIPVYIKPTSRARTIKPRVRTTSTTPPTTSKKYYIKSVNKRPTPFSANNQEVVDSTENAINTEALIESGLQNARVNELSNLAPNKTLNEQPPTREYDRSQYDWNEPAISPFKTLDNLRNAYKNVEIRDYTTSTTSTTVSTTTTRRSTRHRNAKEKHSRTKPSYYSYRLEDEVVPDQTTEIFNGKVKTVIKAFLNNFVSSPEPEFIEELITTTTPKPTTPIQREEDEVVNIGFQKKTLKYVDEKPLRNNVKRLQIITEPTVSRYVTPSAESIVVTENESEAKDFSSTTTTMSSMSSTPFTYVNLPTPSMPIQSSINDFKSAPSRDSYQSKVSSFVTNKPENEGSRKFQNIISNVPSTETIIPDISINDEVEISNQSIVEDIRTTTETMRHRPSVVESEIASTTSTTKSTTTLKYEPTTTTTKSISFPPRASRVNPAIKLAATNPGGGRRSYQSSSKCSSDNSLQANPKCNEIKYQRTTSTRGRGSAHYSASNDAQSQPAPNRGTPPTRSRPTLKPSTAIVSKTTEFVDIYTNPPTRPGPVYPQPTPDKTAAKCRKDVCLLPDCYCGGKEIPGDMPVEQVPQIVLLTFDDSVNDLNKGLYADLFEKGRVNPNGCPISATFYVSHEWTDYSQVQNLYSAGHEMASHTISHSFGEQFSQKKWYREVGGQREILAAYGGVKLEDVRGMRAPFLSVGGNKMFKMLYDANFTYDSSLPVYENRPPSWPYTLDYKLFHDCMIPPCPTKSYPGVWEVPMVMWQDLNGGRCSMGDACANPPEAENVYKMILKNFDRHYTTNRAPFGLFYHAAWFTQPHHKEGFIMFLDFINQMQDVWIVTNWQALQWVRDPTPINRLNNFQPFQCNYQDRPKKCNNPKVCNLWHKSGVRYMRTCQPCPEVYPWTGKSGIRSSRIDNDIGE